jgi:hypothetical protein
MMADPISDPKRISTALLPVATIAIRVVRGDVSSRNSPEQQGRAAFWRLRA